MRENHSQISSLSPLQNPVEWRVKNLFSHYRVKKIFPHKKCWQAIWYSMFYVRHYNNRCVMESLVLFRFGMWKRFFDVKKFTIKYEKLDLVQTEEKKEFCCKFSTYHNGGKCLNIYAKCFSPQIASEKCSWHFIDFSIFFFKPNDTASRVEKISNWVRKKFCW